MKALFVKIASRQKRKEGAASAASRKAGRQGWGDPPKGPSLGRAAASAQPKPPLNNSSSPVATSSASNSGAPSKSNAGLAKAMGAGALVGALGIYKIKKALKRRAEERAKKDHQDSIKGEI
jgi:hypothetical protein